MRKFASVTTAAMPFAPLSNPSATVHAAKLRRIGIVSLAKAGAFVVGGFAGKYDSDIVAPLSVMLTRLPPCVADRSNFPPLFGEVRLIM